MLEGFVPEWSLSLVGLGIEQPTASLSIELTRADKVQARLLRQSAEEALATLSQEKEARSK